MFGLDWFVWFVCLFPGILENFAQTHIHTRPLLHEVLHQVQVSSPCHFANQIHRILKIMIKAQTSKQANKQTQQKKRGFKSACEIHEVVNGQKRFRMASWCSGRLCLKTEGTHLDEFGGIACLHQKLHQFHVSGGNRAVKCSGRILFFQMCTKQAEREMEAERDRDRDRKTKKRRNTQFQIERYQSQEGTNQSNGAGKNSHRYSNTSVVIAHSSWSPHRHRISRQDTSPSPSAHEVLRLAVLMFSAAINNQPNNQPNNK
jgi:hypothetical protein